MNSETKIQRLTMLKDLMLNHDKHFPKMSFNIKAWKVDELQMKKLNIKDKKDCGTAACALGSAACYQPFINMGLKIQMAPDGSVARLMGLPTEYPAFDGKREFGAGAEFFGITMDESRYLFNPMDYKRVEIGDDSNDVTAEMVANRVQKLINDEVAKVCTQSSAS